MKRRSFLTGAAVLGTVLAVGVAPSAQAETPKLPLKLGKGPASSDQVALKAAPYFYEPSLEVPENFGHHDILDPNGWGMLGNDIMGNCVFAGAAHEHQVWSRLGGTPADFSFTNVMDAYSDVTGYDPSRTDRQGNNPTDRGTVLAKALKYRRNHGIFDRNGNIHRIEGYAALDEGDVEMLAKAAYMFSVVGIGFTVPLYAMKQFLDGEPWHLPARRSLIDLVVGGHYVPVIGRQDGYFVTVSWGQIQLMTPEFYEYWSDEAYALFDQDFLRDDKSPEGFDKERLLEDLEKLRS